MKLTCFLIPVRPRSSLQRAKRKSVTDVQDKRSQITIIGCGNAMGQAISLFIIFAVKQLDDLWMKEEVPGSHFAVSNRSRPVSLLADRAPSGTCCSFLSTAPTFGRPQFSF